MGAGMGDRIVGICRFSFVGRGDWKRFSGADDAALPALMEAQARDLFTPARLARRFRAFEAICLPSIAAQTDRDFRFLVLTSPLMPAPWLERLRACVAEVPMAELIVSDAAHVGAALVPRLAQIAAGTPGGSVVQFRLDDDDALARDFIANLRRHVARLSDLPAFAVSFRRNMAVTLYPGARAEFWRFDEPFYGAGLAIKPRRASGTIFDYGHFGSQRRLTHILDTTEMGGLVLKWPSDSRAEVVGQEHHGYFPLAEDAFRGHLRRDFPFLRGFDFDSLRQRDRAGRAEPAPARPPQGEA